MTTTVVEGRAPVRTLVVWCSDWPVVAAGLSPDVPAVVVRSQRVAASSPSARAEGVVPGISRREAQARCPGLTVLPDDPGGEARAFEPVVRAVEAICPEVEVRRPGVCALATRGPSRLAGGDLALARKVAVAVGAAVPAGDWPVRVGVADGPFAAGLAARRGLVVPEGGTGAFLSSLPVGALGRPELADVLVRLGIRTLGQLGELPAPDVLARFGAEGALVHRLALGQDGRQLVGRVPPPDPAVAIELDPPAERAETVAFAARGAAEELHQRLHRLGLGCTRVLIEAETEHGERLARCWAHDAPLSPVALAERVRWQLDGWLGGTVAAGRPTAGITLVRLVADEVVADGGREAGFWGGTAEVDDRASRTLARVQGILGPEGVQTAVLGGGRDPGEQVSLVPWGDRRPGPRPGTPARARTRERLGARAGIRDRPGARDGDAPWPGSIPIPAPAVVHPSPLPAEVVDLLGHAVAVSGRGLVSAAPAGLSMSGSPWTEVSGWAGPWLADERWWEPRAHRRRARFQMVAGGTAHLLVAEAGRWWVEASYD